MEEKMKLSAPKYSTFIIAVILAVLGFLGHFAVAALAPYAFWLVLIGFVLLAIANMTKGL
jgi:fatty acid desaturase